MSKASNTARAKAIRLCGGGAPSMRKHREDGGSAGNGSSSGESNPAPVIMPEPPPPPAADKAGAGEPTIGIKIGGPPAASTGPRELNAGVMRRGGRARSAAR